MAKKVNYSNFVKYDDHKLRYGLVPPEILEELAKVFTYGANKYKKDNWKLNTDIDRYTDALFRHIEAWRMGEVKDPESGLLHLSHAMTNLGFIIYLIKRNSK